MENQRIYWTSIEFSLLDTHESFGKLAGGLVYAFVMSEDAESALQRFKQACLAERVNPFDFEYIEPYEEVQWEDDADQKNFDTLYQEASQGPEVIFDIFYMYQEK